MSSVGHSYWMMCKICRAEGPLAVYGEEEAEELWNTRKNFSNFIPIDPTKGIPEKPKLTHIFGFSGIPEDKMKREVIVSLYDNKVYKIDIYSYLKDNQPIITSIGLTKFGCEILMAALEEALNNIENHKL